MDMWYYKRLRAKLYKLCKMSKKRDIYIIGSNIELTYPELQDILYLWIMKAEQEFSFLNMKKVDYVINVENQMEKDNEDIKHKLFGW